MFTRGYWIFLGTEAPSIPGSLSDQGYSKTYEQASNIQDWGGPQSMCGYLNTETLGYPLVNIQKTMENHGKSWKITICNGNIHYK